MLVILTSPAYRATEQLACKIVAPPSSRIPSPEFPSPESGVPGSEPRVLVISG